MITLTLVPSHSIAVWLLTSIQGMLNEFHLGNFAHLDEIIYSAIVIFVALFVALIVRRLAIVILRKVLKLRYSALAKQILDLKIASRCTHVITPLVLMSFVPLAFETNHMIHTILMRGLTVWIIISLSVGINSVITLIWTVVDSRKNSEKHPLRGLLISAHGLVWVIAVIMSIAEITDKNPGALLTGMAAMSAALLLIFKDSILGFVSGILLSQNDMIRVGDWIIVPNTPANGSVEDVTLTVVKVRNWDNTLVMLPPYTLISGSFQNYRGMSEMGRRLIQFNFLIDTSTVFAADETFVNDIIGKYPEVKDFVDKNRQSGTRYLDGAAPVNGTIETNAGLFRAYLCNYLIKHPCISDQEYLIVRNLPPTFNGVPMEVWCYTEGDAINWVKYEAVRSQIIEHILAVAGDFKLGFDVNTISINQPTGESVPPVSQSSANSDVPSTQTGHE